MNAAPKAAGRPKSDPSKVQNNFIRERVTESTRKQYEALGGKAFLLAAMKHAQMQWSGNRKVIATFEPQAWVDDYAIPVDPEGETTFDVTPEILVMGKAAAMKIEDGRESSDDFQFAQNAPAWIKKWKGPFRISVKDEIEAFYE
ncbi:hypothetical protein ACYPKM_02035 [Pseudomonas aeruginosa]